MLKKNNEKKFEFLSLEENCAPTQNWKNFLSIYILRHLTKGVEREEGIWHMVKRNCIMFTQGDLKFSSFSSRNSVMVRRRLLHTDYRNILRGRPLLSWMLKETLKAAEQIWRSAVFKVSIEIDISFRLALKIQTFTRSCNIKEYIFIKNYMFHWELRKTILAIRKCEQSL